MWRFWRGMDRSMWSSHLLLLIVSVFFVNFGESLFLGAGTNYFIDTLHLSGAQVLWLQGIREIPGLTLIALTALTMRLPLVRRAAISVLLMGVGYGLYATVNSYLALVAMALTASFGFHAWVPLQASLGMSLVNKAHSGRVMGMLAAARSLAFIVGMGGLALASLLFRGLSLRFYFVLGGALIIVAAFLLSRLPKNVGAAPSAEPRMLIKKRYWLYYVLILFEGVRTQVFGAFGTLVLVQEFGFQVWHISMILLASGAVNLISAPYIGKLLDRLGERKMLAGGYTLLALGFVGYATFSSPWLVAGTLIVINMLFLCSMGLSTYVNRIAPREELMPTLSAGVSFNHITSVSMSFVAGSLLGIAGYQAVALGAAAFIMVSIPFALAIRTDQAVVAEARPIAVH